MHHIDLYSMHGECHQSCHVPVPQITFVALYHLLNFGSGWDEELMQRSKRDAAETMQFGLLGMAIGGHRIDHHFMQVMNKNMYLPRICLGLIRR